MHDHPHDHAHDPHAAQADHDAGPATAYEVLEAAVRDLLLSKGVLTANEIRAQIDLMDSRTPALGAKVVAKAWTDPDFQTRLIHTPRDAFAEAGVDIGSLAEFRVIANTEDVHNVVVCTLCSCYPKMLLGIPPAWYKSLAYRSRVVREPRAVLSEFGLKLPSDVQVRVHDSTADLRYLILPRRPDATDGWDADKLA
ncbi:MAG: nitrile hydratase subunit alpha, partial [Pseudomonadota bacterium]